MTTGQTRRATMALCGVFLAAALVFAWMAERPAPPLVKPPAAATPAPAAGAAAFQSRCAACHAAEAIAQLIRHAPDPRAKVRAIDALLVSHGEATRDEVQQILLFLEVLASR